MHNNKSTADNPLFATENEFHTLLAIHNEIKKAVYKMFPYIKEQIIETLFSILSSQALLYDQIIRKSILLQGSITKKTQITKLVQNNKITFQKKIQEHLNAFNTNYECPLSESKTGVFTAPTSQGKLTNLSKEDSVFLEQESIFAKLKKKIKLGKTQHIRTNSAGSTFNQYETEGQKQKQNIKQPQTDKKELRSFKKGKMVNKKHIVFSKDKKIVKYNNINLHLDKDNYRSNTQDSFYPSQQGRRSVLSQTKCLTERKDSDMDFFNRGFKLYPLLSYQSFPINNNRKLRRIGSKPTKHTKYLLKKYHDVVDSYEKFETEEDDLIKQNLFHSQIISRTDFNKKTNELHNSTQSFIITDYNKSKNKSKKTNRNISCGSKPAQKNTNNNAWK